MFYYARVLDELGMNDEADIEYQRLIKLQFDAEYAYHYGRFLQKTGNNGKAVEIFQEILRRAKYLHKAVRKSKAVWINLAKDELSGSL